MTVPHSGRVVGSIAASDLQSRMDSRQVIRDLADGFTIETTPGAAVKIAHYRDYLRAGTRVFVTFLPGSDFNDSIKTCIRLAAEDLAPVPHIAVRSIPSLAYLRTSMQRLVDEAGVNEVLVIAGGTDRPLGPWSDSMQLLETGLLDEFSIGHIGLAGHPEGSPDIPAAALGDALRRKNEYARQAQAQVHLVTQFCFEAAPVMKWEQQLRQQGNRLPIRIGIPGLATLKALLGHAKACGVGPSLRFLTRQARAIHRLLQVSAPDVLMTELARARASDQECLIQGIHVYPLGGLRRSAQWFYAAADGDINLNPSGNGFSAATEID